MSSCGDNEPRRGIFRRRVRLGSVIAVNLSIHRLVLLAVVAGLGLLDGAHCLAKDAEDREPRESRAERDLRESREREQRDVQRARQDADREGGRDRSGSNSGSDDHDDDDDKDEDRSGKDGSDRGRRSSGRIDVDRDARGGDRQRDEALLIGPDEAGPAIQRAGYTLLSERRMQSLQQTMVRVRARDGQSIDALIASLRQLVPGARVAPNHIYNPSQQTGASAKPAAAPDRASPPSPPSATQGIGIGVIDTGADKDNPRLRPQLKATRGFASGGYQPRPHGTAVAQLAATQGTSLAVADVFGVDRRNQLVAPAEHIAAALDWMTAQHVRVVNISIEGPYNAVLEFVVQDAIARGVAIVAAVGNGGPAAAPAYPAAYAGVIAVTALDDRGQIYRRAARGEYVQFAARGTYDVKQRVVETRVALAGTSFAAPVVAAEIARRWQARPDASRDSIVAGLRADSTDLGPPGRDPVYGWGRIEAPARSAQDQRAVSGSASLPL
jgi:minor extracellular protease Epr